MKTDKLIQALSKANAQIDRMDENELKRKGFLKEGHILQEKVNELAKQFIK